MHSRCNSHEVHVVTARRQYLFSVGGGGGAGRLVRSCFGTIKLTAHRIACGSVQLNHFIYVPVCWPGNSPTDNWFNWMHRPDQIFKYIATFHRLFRLKIFHIRIFENQLQSDAHKAWGLVYF